MNMKTLAVLVLMGLSLSAWASGDENTNTTQDTAGKKDKLDKTEGQVTNPAVTEVSGFDTGKVSDDCKILKEDQTKVKNHPKFKECTQLKQIANKVGYQEIVPVDEKESIVQSLDKAITCRKKQSYTFDYEKCESAVSAYNFVVNAETALNLTQTIRTQTKNQNIQADASKQVAAGGTQTAALDSAQKSNEHQKQMQQEKVAAYALAVGALVNAYRQIPVKEDVLKVCGGNACDNTFEKHKGGILANQNAKAALAMAISTFTAKGIAAGIAMKNYDNAAQQIAKAKAPLEEESEDLMMDRCAFNPNDPACVKPGQRLSGTQYRGGEFSLGGDGVGNAFNMTPESDTPIEMGAETNLEGESVASMNSPFVDDAKVANDILNPAGAAQMQAGNSGAGGGGGGAGGGMGGGGASLGSDLAGAEKDGNKEASLKTNKITGNYSSGGGGGFKGIKKGKEDANPFASLFDAKSSGGIEEDRSIASGDIDGESSGLFQKISKRYGQIQADKRIEANNLE